MFNFLPVRSHRSFFGKLFSSLFPELYRFMGLFCSRYRTSHLFLLNFMRFPLLYFSSLLRLLLSGSPAIKHVDLSPSSFLFTPFTSCRVFYRGCSRTIVTACWRKHIQSQQWPRGKFMYVWKYTHKCTDTLPNEVWTKWIYWNLLHSVGFQLCCILGVYFKDPLLQE